MDHLIRCTVNVGRDPDNKYFTSFQQTSPGQHLVRDTKMYPIGGDDRRDWAHGQTAKFATVSRTTTGQPKKPDEPDAIQDK